jgi:hypothetical protein
LDVGSPPQIWNTLAVTGDLRTTEGRRQEALQAYADAVSVIDGVASRLTDERLRAAFIDSEPVRRIRLAAEAGR